MTRRLRVFAEKEDLENIFKKFQDILEVYYVPTYSDVGPVEIYDITMIQDFGKNFHGSHIGNNQFRILLKSKQCVWKEYQYKVDEENVGMRYTSLWEGNNEAIDIDLGGIYQESNLFPTEIGTIHYDNKKVKELYEQLKKVVKKESVHTVNGYFICKKAYENRSGYRFCTININSPSEYDLDVK